MQLALTLATVLVALLRRPCRIWFGAERACQLWLLPVLAALASQLPHPATASPALPDVVLKIASTQTLPVVAHDATQLSRLGGMFTVWLLGAVGVGLRAWSAQRRYRRSMEGAQRVLEPCLRWPVLRSLDPACGPATVGAWRPCIVLPADFESRYGEAERRLILSHEACHARRGDGGWMLCAQLVVAACWFHPLAWWALRALRRDQELACDAAVLRDHRGERGTYARAMLKTQSMAFALPVGCCWLSRHPITERIAMLNMKQPGIVGRRAGAALLAGLALVLTSAVYAANQPPATRASVGKSAQSDHYALKLELGIDGKPARLHATSCLRAGQYYETVQGGIDPLPPWHARFTVVPAGNGLLEVQGELSGGMLNQASYPKVRMYPGQKGTIEAGQYDHQANGMVVGSHTLKVDLTPSIGC
jgi:beta-lactamase regulating signal transducer with metallopeptidase domain